MRPNRVRNNTEGFLIIFDSRDRRSRPCPGLKVRKTAFFLKIDPVPFSDFGAAEGGTVLPKKIWRRRRLQNHWRKKFAAADGGKIVKLTRLGAAEGSTNVEKSLIPPKTVKTLKNFFSASGFVWWINKRWRQLHSEEFRFVAVWAVKTYNVPIARLQHSFWHYNLISTQF